MQIEAGKYYRTRDGRKVGPMIGPNWAGMYRDHETFQKTNTPDAPQWWEEDGSVAMMAPHERGDVLVAEWSEGPVRTETVKRIVEGRYGLVDIDTHKDQIVVSINPSMGWNASAEDLRAAAVVLNQIADAL